MENNRMTKEEIYVKKTKKCSKIIYFLLYFLFRNVYPSTFFDVFSKNSNTQEI